MERYPLTWPTGWKRTAPGARRRAQFGKAVQQQSGESRWTSKGDLSIADAVQRLCGELRRMLVAERDILISTNLRVRLDGLPLSKQAQPADPGVAVYWTSSQGEQRCMGVDHYDKIEHNIAAIAATLEAMRAIERHGGAAILNRAFTGFTALPPPGQTSGRGWREVLGFKPDERVTATEVDLAYRKRRSAAHPDKPGGNAEEFNAVQRAYELATQEVPA